MTFVQRLGRSFQVTAFNILRQVAAVSRQSGTIANNADDYYNSNKNLEKKHLIKGVREPETKR